jgi:hypothetical protein
VTSIREKKNAHRVLVERSERRGPAGIPRPRQRVLLKWILKE